MALQLGALREALLDAGASPAKADKAAEEVASYENRLAGVETKLVKLDGRVNLLTWMVGGLYGVLIVMGAPAIWLLLRVAAKVCALG
jgi:hypothetical protein